MQSSVAVWAAAGISLPAQFVLSAGFRQESIIRNMNPGTCLHNGSGEEKFGRQQTNVFNDKGNPPEQNSLSGGLMKIRTAATHLCLELSDLETEVVGGVISCYEPKQRCADSLQRS